MVAHGDAIRARIQNILRLIRGDANHRGILTVDHHKISAAFPLQLPQMAADLLHTRIAHHIAYGQNFELHKISSYANILSKSITHFPLLRKL